MDLSGSSHISRTGSPSIGRPVSTTPGEIPKYISLNLSSRESEQLSSAQSKSEGEVTTQIESPESILNELISLANLHGHEFIPCTTGSMRLKKTEESKGSESGDEEEEYEATPSSSSNDSECEELNADTTFETPSSKSSESGDSLRPASFDRTQAAASIQGTIFNPISLDNNNLPSGLKIHGVAIDDHGLNRLLYRGSNGKFYISEPTTNPSFHTPQSSVTPSIAVSTPEIGSSQPISQAPTPPSFSYTEMTQAKPHTKGLFESLMSKPLFAFMFTFTGELFKNTFLPLYYMDQIMRDTFWDPMSMYKNKNETPNTAARTSARATTTQPSANTPLIAAEPSRQLEEPPQPLSRLHGRPGTQNNPVIIDFTEGIPPANYLNTTDEFIVMDGRCYEIMEGSGPFEGNFFAIEESIVDSATSIPSSGLEKTATTGTSENPITSSLPPPGSRVQFSSSDDPSASHHVGQESRNISGTPHQVLEGSNPFAVPESDVNSASIAKPTAASRKTRFSGEETPFHRPIDESASATKSEKESASDSNTNSSASVETFFNDDYDDITPTGSKTRPPRSRSSQTEVKSPEEKSASYHSVAASQSSSDADNESNFSESVETLSASDYDEIPSDTATSTSASLKSSTSFQSTSTESTVPVEIEKPDINERYGTRTNPIVTTSSDDLPPLYTKLNSVMEINGKLYDIVVFKNGDQFESIFYAAERNTPIATPQTTSTEEISAASTPESQAKQVPSFGSGTIHDPYVGALPPKNMREEIPQYGYFGNDPFTQYIVYQGKTDTDYEYQYFAVPTSEENSAPEALPVDPSMDIKSQKSIGFHLENENPQPIVFDPFAVTEPDSAISAETQTISPPEAANQPPTSTPDETEVRQSTAESSIETPSQPSSDYDIPPSEASSTSETESTSSRTDSTPESDTSSTSTHSDYYNTFSSDDANSSGIPDEDND